MGTTSDFYISRDNGDMLWIGGTYGDGYQIAEADGDDLSNNDRKYRTRKFMAHKLRYFEGTEEEYTETVLEFLYTVCEAPMIHYFNHGYYDGQIGNPCLNDFIYVYKNGKLWVKYHTEEKKILADDSEGEFREISFTPTSTYGVDDDYYLIMNQSTESIKLSLPTSSDKLKYLYDNREEYDVWLQGDAIHPEPIFIGKAMANNLREACEILIKKEILLNKGKGKYKFGDYDPATALTYCGRKLFSSTTLATK